MPGVVDAVSVATMRVDRATAILGAVMFDAGGGGRSLPAASPEWRPMLQEAIRSLQEAVDALNRALDEE